LYGAVPGVGLSYTAPLKTPRIPEPEFALIAPANRDRRDTMEIRPEIRNLESLQNAGAGELDYRWEVSGLATIKDEEPGKPTGNTEDFDGIYLQHPCPVLVNGQWRLYYNGWTLNPAAKNRIKAEYAIGLPFTKE